LTYNVHLGYILKRKWLDAISYFELTLSKATVNETYTGTAYVT